MGDARNAEVLLRSKAGRSVSHLRPTAGRDDRFITTYNYVTAHFLGREGWAGARRIASTV